MGCENEQQELLHIVLSVMGSPVWKHDSFKINADYDTLAFFRQDKKSRDWNVQGQNGNFTGTEKQMVKLQHI